MRTALRYPAIAAIIVMAGWGPALAQSNDRAHPSSANEPSIPNVPDRNGCVRLCEFDLNPCDSPIDKKLDGRCTLKH